MPTYTFLTCPRCKDGQRFDDSHVGKHIGYSCNICGYFTMKNQAVTHDFEDLDLDEEYNELTDILNTKMDALDEFLVNAEIDSVLGGDDDELDNNDEFDSIFTLSDDDLFDDDEDVDFDDLFEI